MPESASPKPSLSVVVPAYNESDVLPEFYRRTVAVLEAMSPDYELVFVNDGSTDDTLAILHHLAEQDHHVAYVNLSRNFGKEIALSAGLDHAQGEAVIVIDADLQDPPEVMQTLYDTWQQKQCDVVYAKRRVRHGETWFKKATAQAFYWVIGKVSKVQIPDNVGDFRLMNRRSLNALKTLREHHRFMKGLFAWIGYNQVAIEYERDARFAGDTKWNYWRLWNFALEGITSFTSAPLKITSYLGVLTSLLGFGFAMVIIYKTLFYGDPVQGWPSTMVVILILGGIQLLSIGVIGEYLARMFDETKQRPLYLVDVYQASCLQLTRPDQTDPATGLKTGTDPKQVNVNDSPLTGSRSDPALADAIPVTQTASPPDNPS